MGYRTALLADHDAASFDADLVVSVPFYRGYFLAVAELCRAIGPAADIVVTGGDDMFPDPAAHANEVAKEFFQRFPDGFGIMQPTGDELGGNERYCGSPWMGRGWIERAYGGAGPFWHRYFQFFGDVELGEIARKLGVLWLRPDLAQYHEHWSRPGGPAKTDYQCRNEQQHFRRDERIYRGRLVRNFPGHEALPAQARSVP